MPDQAKHWTFRTGCGRGTALACVLALCAILTPTVQGQAAAETRDPRAWFFAQSFGDLPEELQEARDGGKLGLLLFFEQEGCPYCERMMKTVLNQAAVQDWYRERFVSIAIDINGDVEITDVDGVTLPMKVFAGHRLVKTTPTLLFIDLTGAEVHRRTKMVNSPEEFLLIGRYVAEGQYTDTPWRSFEQEQSDAATGAGGDMLPLATDLQAEGAAAAAAGATLLLTVTREGCPYCARLRREVLWPMIRSGDYAGRVRIREIMMEPDTTLRDFDGQDSTTAAVAARYAVSIAPTVLLLDGSGSSLHAPLVGVNNTEMYGEYLDRALAQATAQRGPESREEE
jgi:thioredoxin-related protein